MFTPRLTRPETGNPYYTRKVSGGVCGPKTSAALLADQSSMD